MASTANNEKGFIKSALEYWQIIIALVGIFAGAAIALYRIDEQSSELETISERQKTIIEDVAFIRGQLESCCGRSSSELPACEECSFSGEMVSFVCCD